MRKALRPVLFSGMLLLATYLRVVGLTWGLNSGYGIDRNFQPDEFLSLRGVLEVDLLTGDIKAPAAYFEGTFNYYFWAVPQAVLKIVANKRGLPADSTNPNVYSDLLLICRWMSVLFDLCTIIVVFLAIREATQSFYPSLLGAFVYAILPMQVIYSHFMRPHVLSNLFCSLVLWLSLKVVRSRKWWLFLILGIISGLAAATRFPVGVIVTIPFLFVIFAPREGSTLGVQRLWQALRYLLSGPVWLIALGFVCGLFVGHPMLVVDTPTVIAVLSSDTLKWVRRNEFAPTRLLDLSEAWKYLSFLIPYGMYPLLWIMPYSAIIYLAFRRSLHVFTFPIVIFSLLYLYPMAKAYVGPYWARAVMPLFPGFCVLIGLACSDLLRSLREQRIGTVVLTVALLLFIAPSVVFDVAYGRAMQQKDARSTLSEDLQSLIGESPATIGISRFGPYFYTVMPAAVPLKSEKVKVQVQDPSEKADFFLSGFSGEVAPAVINAFGRQVEAEGKFKYVQTYRVPVSIFGHEFRLTHFPQDMTYPFPTILLFRSNVPNFN
jgi:hypothetical protein